MGPQSNTYILYGDGRSVDGSFRPLHHKRRAGPFGDGYLAVLPGHILLRSTADGPGARGGHKRSRFTGCDVRHDEPSRRDRAVLSHGISGALRDATGTWN